MIPTAVAAFQIGIFVHVLAVLLAFGPTFGFAFIAAFAEKEPAAAPTLHRVILATQRYLVAPMMALVLLAGLYAVWKEHLKLSESFVSVGIAAILILGAMHGMIFVPKGKQALELAERDVKSGGALSDEYAAVAKTLGIAGRIAGLIIAVTVYFMVVRP